MQLISVCMKALAAWVNKSDVDTGIVRFFSHWTQLEQFMRGVDGGDPLSLECPYIWHTYYEVLAVEPECDVFPAELGAKMLQDRLLLDPPTSVPSPRSSGAP